MTLVISREIKYISIPLELNIGVSLERVEAKSEGPLKCVSIGITISINRLGVCHLERNQVLYSEPRCCPFVI
ncbi:hypothetical protein HanHA300_Chr04g0133891 [Helianthus annuus]|nr:hypothetical protein HanHA300_Chr04g0133891 [Helianthus annuus]KAJ0596771.1 hypothetical protein HanHA89_Chr04g0146761 [Helianthus annuus]KAJ0757451.1 hypothetical protein HanLR1_Chr04g0138891 [Helianthus annuus]KAJ0761149.1 hypothetical protein HanOQP8_Chr04g0146411 [Helianthus annuus]